MLSREPVRAVVIAPGLVSQCLDLADRMFTGAA
jgi:hypothetical protein